MIYNRPKVSAWIADMGANTLSFVVRKIRNDILPFVEQVKQSADSSPNELGFLPEQVYLEAALQQKLLIAVACQHGHETYAGHLLFGGSYPFLKVFQIYVTPLCRGQGAARKLIEALVKEAEAIGYLSISARVASDLIPANRFWERNDFHIATTKAGGASTGRKIYLRVRNLQTPDLFSVLGQAPTADFHLEDRLLDRHDTFAIDLNVLFDLVRGRSNASFVRTILSRSLDGVITLRVTDEFINELERTTIPGKPDHTLDFARSLPRFPKLSPESLRECIEDLARDVFPNRFAAGSLTAQDRSDLFHLASAVHYKISGFITGERAILEARPALLRKHGLDVFSPAELAETLTPAGWSAEHDYRSAQGCELSVADMHESERSQMREFLIALSVPEDIINLALSTGSTGALRRRIKISSQDRVQGFASWAAPHGLLSRMEILIWVDEELAGAETIADHLLSTALADASKVGPLLLSWRADSRQSVVRRCALAQGFRAAHKLSGEATDTLSKICVGRAVSHEDWNETRLDVHKVSGVGLPEAFPECKGVETMFAVTNPRGEQTQVSLREIETLLSPVLFLLPGRTGVIVPIRKAFAEELFRFSPQPSLLARREAGLLSERIYYSNKRNINLLRPGCPILFYESLKKNGRGEIFACGRVIRSEHRSPAELPINLERRGVLSVDNLQRMNYLKCVTVTYFDNIMKFRNPVGIEVLRSKGWVKCASLVTAGAIDAVKLSQILSLGQPNG